jgi:polyribonucleotide nucleotidyltransferase
MSQEAPYKVNVEVGGRTLTLETGKLAKQANGAVVAKYGETRRPGNRLHGYQSQ